MQESEAGVDSQAFFWDEATNESKVVLEAVDFDQQCILTEADNDDDQAFTREDCGNDRNKVSGTPGGLRS